MRTAAWSCAIFALLAVSLLSAQAPAAEIIFSEEESANIDNWQDGPGWFNPTHLAQIQDGKITLNGGANISTRSEFEDFCVFFHVLDKNPNGGINFIFLFRCMDNDFNTCYGTYSKQEKGEQRAETGNKQSFGIDVPLLFEIGSEWDIKLVMEGFDRVWQMRDSESGELILEYRGTDPGQRYRKGTMGFFTDGNNYEISRFVVYDSDPGPGLWWPEESRPVEPSDKLTVSWARIKAQQ